MNGASSYISGNSTPFLRTAKLKGARKIEVASRHNLREIQAELGAYSHIDPHRSEANIILRGERTAQKVTQRANQLMLDAGVSKLRKDAVRAIEIVFSLSPNVEIDVNGFFAKATSWAEAYFQVPILSSVIHHDEQAPHCHVLMLPLVGNRLVGSDLIGNRQSLERMQSDFYANVAHGFGLQRPARSKEYSKAKRQEMAVQVLTVIKDDPTKLKNASIFAALMEAIAIQAPVKLLELLNIPIKLDSMRKIKSSTSIFIKKMKSEKPIGFESSEGKSKHQTLCSVGFTKSDPEISASNSTNQTELIRERDDAIPSEFWDSDGGKFAL
ncbi:plasmid recombination protein [Polynucleobacter sp. AP-Nino-20-G2]|uniref:plasmid recombination protein n=1 Tax=Polynucleobacter sp. AP-Nino-20-G2 TaxID=2576917 RepID=UPI001BFE2225|nr:plasmid recombination protein [Polynucleobacter sp. AP-Nino-20-G2]QWE17085.1 plasmid recombination protein [Polynucleobacter sp. AP-Nino-20-G2]